MNSRNTNFILVILLILLAGCSGIRVEKSINVSPEDWIMAGGSSLQQNISGYTLEPPLNLMWDYNIEGGVGPAGITSTDAVVFVNALQGEMFTFDVATGGKIGNIKFLGKDASTAPLVLGNDVIVSFAGDKKYSLVSYDLSEGNINWRKKYGDIQTSPILKNGYVYFGSLNGNLYKVDITTGLKSWKFDSKAPIHSTCAVGTEKVIFGNDAGTLYCLNTATGDKLWEFKTGGPVISTPMIKDGYVFIGGDDSNYCVIGLDSGTARWKQNMHSKMISGSALYQDSNAIFGCVDGSIYSLKIEDGTINWKYSTKGAIISTPVVSGNLVYCSSYDGFIYSLDADDGRLLWSYELENKVRTSPVIWKDYLFVAADEIVYCFTSKIVEKKK
ncbi:MAG: PQQ-binding-like beta-propeller repeat protein [Ignavibacteria bacterium]|nr:PQQ-binding-like beta-propeller repeat protein [Ignavibacteria bacterium]